MLHQSDGQRSVHWRRSRDGCSVDVVVFTQCQGVSMPFAIELFCKFTRSVFIDIADDEAIDYLLLFEGNPSSNVVATPVARSNHCNSESHGRATSVLFMTVPTGGCSSSNMGRFDVVVACRGLHGCPHSGGFT